MKTYAISALICGFVLTGCGGGGGGGSSSSSVSSLSISGVAATGAAISLGTVDAKCATGTGTATTNADGSFGFVQNSDLFYLSGIDQEDSILLIFPDVKDGKHKEVLFLKETSELIAIWEGAKLNKSQATAVSGIDHIYWISEFDKVFKSLVFQAEHIYLNSNEHTRRYIDMETAEMRFNKKIKEIEKIEKIDDFAKSFSSISIRISNNFKAF